MSAATYPFPIPNEARAHLVISPGASFGSDAVAVRAGVYPDPFAPGLDLPKQHAIQEIGGELLRIERFSGTGALVDLFDQSVQSVVQKVLTAYTFHAVLTRRLDFALFAVDHDDGHGTRVAAGVRELWAAAGARTWNDCAERRERLITWMRAAGEWQP